MTEKQLNDELNRLIDELIDYGFQLSDHLRRAAELECLIKYQDQKIQNVKEQLALLRLVQFCNTPRLFAPVL